MPRVARIRTRSRALRADNDVTSSRNRQTRSGQQPSSLPPIKATVVRQVPKPPALAFLSRSRDVISADPNRQNRLFKLPKELLQHVADYLPRISIICLTLTCKEAVEAIGTESWAEYKREKRWLRNGEEFYKFLGRDWGDILDFCPRCDTLHPVLPPPRSHRETKLTKWCYGQDAMIDYLPHDASHGYNPVFAHIIEAMVESEGFTSKGENGPLIDNLSGDFTITKKDLSWTLVSSARRIDRNLVLRHVHTIRPQASKSLTAKDLLALPIRLCPHQSTTTNKPERSRYIRGKCIEKNSRLLSQVIVSALPTAAQRNADLSMLKDLTPGEEARRLATLDEEAPIWRCRSCPTKYQVRYRNDELSITTWHSFGRELYNSSKYWKWFVRRTGTTLGTDKRNDEWWSLSRTIADFVCDLE